MKIIFIHGMGQDESSWFKVIRQLTDLECLTYSFNSIIKDSKVPTYQIIKKDLHSYLVTMNEPYILCGLSLGGKLALDLAASLDSMLKGIILISTTFNEQKSIGYSMKLGALSLLPSTGFKKQTGLSKDQVMSVMSSIRDLNLSSQARELRLPVLVVAGTLDKSSLKASQQLSDLILNSTVVTFEGAKHQLNETHYAELASHIHQYVSQLDV